MISILVGAVIGAVVGVVIGLVTFNTWANWRATRKIKKGQS